MKSFCRFCPASFVYIKWPNNYSTPAKKAVEKGDISLELYTGNGIGSKRFHESKLISMSNKDNNKKVKTWNNN